MKLPFGNKLPPFSIGGEIKMTQLGEWTARDRIGKESGDCGEVRREHEVDLVSRPGVRVTKHNSCYNSVDQMSSPSRRNQLIYKNYSTLPEPAVLCLGS